jgi:hypothetical protein
LPLVNSTLFLFQDTTLRTSRDTVPVRDAGVDSASSLRKFSAEEADDIFRTMEQRERMRDSIARVRAHNAYLRSIELKKSAGFDTSAVPYNFTAKESVAVQNPLNPLRKQFYSARDTSKPVFYEQEQAGELTSVTVFNPGPAPSLPSSHSLRPDWLLAIIIGSLVLLAWLKLFYNKFFDQTIQSVGNFQLSTKLLRDQNLFSRRVAFALNVNFIMIGAVYAYLVFGFFHLRPLQTSGFLSVLAYAGIIAGLLILRYLVSRTLGYVFRMQYEFREYQHQLLLVYKNLGIYLLAIVIGIAYIREELRIYLVFLSGLMLLSAFILRYVNALKIVLNNKDILIFYLILYLCTLEVLPILIFYRLFSSSVLTGQV